MRNHAPAIVNRTVDLKWAGTMVAVARTLDRAPTLDALASYAASSVERGRYQEPGHSRTLPRRVRERNHKRPESRHFERHYFARRRWRRSRWPGLAALGIGLSISRCRAWLSPVIKPGSEKRLSEFGLAICVLVDLVDRLTAPTCARGGVSSVLSGRSRIDLDQRDIQRIA